jgi:IS4 transposase
MNLIHFAVSTIGTIYQERWKIELLFMTFKQHFNIRTFRGTSAADLLGYGPV